MRPMARSLQVIKAITPITLGVSHITVIEQISARNDLTRPTKQLVSLLKTDSADDNVLSVNLKQHTMQWADVSISIRLSALAQRCTAILS